MAVDFLGRFDGQVARVFVNYACDISASAAHAIAVFPNACRDSFHRFHGSCFHAADPTEKCWRNNVRYGGLVQWESAGAQAGNIDSVPGLLAPYSEDLYLAPGSACTDPGTSGSAASDDFDGCDSGAFEYIGSALRTTSSHRPRGASAVYRSDEACC